MLGPFVFRAACCSLLLAVIAAATVWFALPPPEPRPRVLFIPAEQSSYGQRLAAGVRAAAEECEVDLVIASTGAAVDVRRQSELLDQVDPATVDGVLLSPVDSRALNQSIDALVGRTHVITCGVDAEGSQRTNHVGPGAASSGSVAAGLVRSLLPEGGQVAVLFDPCEPRFAERLAAFKAALAFGAPGNAARRWTIAAELSPRPEGDRVARELRRLLAEHPDVACLACFNDALGEAAASVLAEQPRDVKVVVFEPTEATLAALVAGRVDGVVADDPFELGRRAMVQMASLFRCSEVNHPVPGLGAVYLPPEAVTRGNLAAFRTRHAPCSATGVN